MATVGWSYVVERVQNRTVERVVAMPVPPTEWEIVEVKPVYSARTNFRHSSDVFGLGLCAVACSALVYVLMCLTLVQGRSKFDFVTCER